MTVRRGRLLTVNLVSRDNGVGLSTDMRLLEDILGGAGHDVARVPWTDSQMRPCDVAIFLELFNPALVRCAKATVGVFNLEWFPAGWRPHLAGIDQLWAKSVEAYNLLTSWGLRQTVHTGFAGRDLYDPDVPRQMRCLHLRGHSRLKGTEAVLTAWHRHPGLPPLTIVSAEPLRVPRGVTVLPRLPQDEMQRLANESAIHLCPSKSEGWGHYIAEALSVGAIVVTTDASPMSEHVRPGWGYLVPATVGTHHHMLPEHHVHPDALAAAVESAAALPARERKQMGRRARAHLITRNAEFRAAALGLLGRL